MHAILGQIELGSVGLANPLLPDALTVTGESWRFVQAISLGEVFFGAMTYIGNGPNFMVKSIADQSGVKSPSFFEYIWKYSVPILIPMFILVWLLIF